jgi:hypothetical protein
MIFDLKFMMQTYAYQAISKVKGLLITVNKLLNFFFAHCERYF